MEKRLIYALVISLLFFTAYSSIIKKFYPKSQSTQISVSQLQEKGEMPEKTISENLFQQKEDLTNLEETEIDGLIVTYSLRGGYIKNVLSKRYNELLPFYDFGRSLTDANINYHVVKKDNNIIFSSTKGEEKQFIFENNVITIKSTLLLDSSIMIFRNPLDPNMLDQRYQEFFYRQNDNLQRLSFGKVKNESTFNQIKYAGVRNRYFCISLLKSNYQIQWLKNKNEVSLFIFPDKNLSQISIYLGLQKSELLKVVDLEEIINYGFFHGIGVGLVKSLKILYSVTRSWGFSIIILAVLVYLLLFPFTMSSTKAMKRMQDVQPKIEEIKIKNKDNPQKMNKEILELYKEYRINPLGGCLPLFLQFPVFISLYQVFLRFIDLKGVSFLWIKDLALPDRAFHLPFSLPFLGEYINILPLFILVVSVIQQRVATSSSASTDQQKIMGLFFGVFIAFIFYNFPASIVIYWFVQNTLTLLYHIKIHKS